MDYTDINSFLEFIKDYCSTGENDNNSKTTKGECEYDPSGGANNNYCRNANSDIPGGFQDVNPELFIALGDILGLIMSCNMPFNVQNAFGNWLQLVGQAILTYNAQQQYFMGGPGRFFNPKYRNVNNPFYSASTDESGTESPKKRTKDSTKYNNDELVGLINKLSDEIKDLKEQINEIKNKE